MMVWCVAEYYPDLARDNVPSLRLFKTLESAHVEAREVVASWHDRSLDTPGDDLTDEYNTHTSKIDSHSMGAVHVDYGDTGVWVFPMNVDN